MSYCLRQGRYVQRPQTFWDPLRTRKRLDIERRFFYAASATPRSKECFHSIPQFLGPT